MSDLRYQNRLPVGLQTMTPPQSRMGGERTAHCGGHVPWRHLFMQV